jgi:hypothetical protein
MYEWDGKPGMYTLTNVDVWIIGFELEGNHNIDYGIGA